MNQPDHKPVHTQIIKWEDGNNLWSMTIKPGAVTIKTTDGSVPAKAVQSLGDQWADAYSFLGATFERKPNA